MKKKAIALMSFVCSLCALAAVAVFTPNAKVAAETELFTETKCQISENGEKLLVVTGITDVSAIYEMGYEINGGEYIPSGEDVAETTTYYTGLTLSGTTKTAGEFIDGAEGLLVWEIAYDAENPYTIKPYALVGEWEGETLVQPENNEKTYGAVKEINEVKYTVSVYKANNDGGYVEVTSVEQTAMPGKTVTTEGIDLPEVPSGYDVGANSVTQAVVKGDGTTELKVYWEFEKISTDFKTWNVWYSEANAQIGTNNATDAVHAAGVHFATESTKAYLSGKYVTPAFSFQGFSVSSGDTYIRLRPRGKAYEIWTMKKNNATTIVAEETANNTKLVAVTGAGDTSVMSNFGYNISGSGELKTWNFALVVKNDKLHVFLENYFCWLIDLTKYGFTAGSEYNLGIVRENRSANQTFTIDNVKVRRDSAVDDIFANFEKIDYKTFTQVNWGQFEAMATYTLDGGVIMQRQQVMDEVYGNCDYNGTYATYFKSASDTVYYKSTLTVAKGEGLTFDSGFGFAIKSGTTEYGFNFGASSMKEWLTVKAEVSQYVVNAEKVAEITAKNVSGEDKVFAVEYIVSGNTLYMFVDGTLTVKIALSELNAAFVSGTTYQIGVFMRWPTSTHKVGYYAPTVEYGTAAATLIANTGYTLN